MSLLDNYYNDSSKHTYMDVSGYDLIIFDYLKRYGLKGKTCLEIGAGFGRYTNCLRQHGAKVLAVEPNDYMVKVHQENFHDDDYVKTIQADLEGCLELEELEEVEYIFLFHVLHHLPFEQFDNVRKLTEKSAASLVIVEPNHINPLFFAQIFVTSDMTWTEEKGMFRNNTSNLYHKYFSTEDYSIKRDYIGFLPRELSNKLSEKKALFSNSAVLSSSVNMPWWAYSMGEICKR